LTNKDLMLNYNLMPTGERSLNFQEDVYEVQFA